MPENDITRLPRWAQDEIARLKASVEHHKARADATQSGESEVWLQDYDAERKGETTFLPPRSRVVFRLPYDISPGHEATITVHVERDRLKLYAPDGPLVLRPEVSNTLGVLVARRSDD